MLLRISDTTTLAAVPIPPDFTVEVDSAQLLKKPFKPSVFFIPAAFKLNLISLISPVISPAGFVRACKRSS